MKKKEIPIEEWIELYVQATATMNDNLKKNTQIHLNFEKKINSISTKPNLTDMIINQKQYLEKIDLLSQKHLELIDESSKKFKETSQFSRTQNFRYVFILNLFFFLTTGISVYIAIKNNISTNELRELKNRNFELQNKISKINTFFIQNPKNLKLYKKWDQKLKENN